MDILWGLNLHAHHVRSDILLPGMKVKWPVLSDELEALTVGYLGEMKPESRYI